MIGVFAQAENVKNLKNLGYFHVKLLAKFGLAFITSNTYDFSTQDTQQNWVINEIIKNVLCVCTAILDNESPLIRQLHVEVM